tara:strand:- start:2032 stop:2388 length:357 start_codon:yes stop_codon:yes gene_type:complete
MKFCFYIFCLLVLVCFTDNSEAINTRNLNIHLEELAFSKEAKDSLDLLDCIAIASIIQYTFNLAHVFEVNTCSQIAGDQSLSYNYTGDVICTFGRISGVNTGPKFYKMITNKIILWGN